MNVVFSNHALLKIQQRKLSKSKIFTVIAHPDRAEYTYSGREALYKKFRKRSLKVVIMREYGTYCRGNDALGCLNEFYGLH